MNKINIIIKFLILPIVTLTMSDRVNPLELMAAQTYTPLSLLLKSGMNNVVSSTCDALSAINPSNFIH